MMSNKELANKLIVDLMGSCGTIDEALAYYGYTDITKVDNEVFRIVDEAIFCCEICGWWYEVSQMSEDIGVCCDCSPEEEED